MNNSSGQQTSLKIYSLANRNVFILHSHVQACCWGVRAASSAWFRVMDYLGQNSDANISVSKFSLVHPFTLRRRASRWCVRRLGTCYWLHIRCLLWGPLFHGQSSVSLLSKWLKLKRVFLPGTVAFWIQHRIQEARLEGFLIRGSCIQLESLWGTTALGAGQPGPALTNNNPKQASIQAVQLSLPYENKPWFPCGTVRNNKTCWFDLSYFSYLLNWLEIYWVYENSETIHVIKCSFDLRDLAEAPHHPFLRVVALCRSGVCLLTVFTEFGT